MVRPRGWHLPGEARARGRRAGAPRALFDFGLFFFHNARAPARARHRAVLLPAEDGEPSRGAPLERRLRRAQDALRHSAAARSARRCSSRRCPRRSRWTRSSASCASTRPASTAGAGTTSSASSRSSARGRMSLLPDRGRVTMDRALPARVLGAPDPDLPSPRHPRDGRHGGADPDQGRPGGQRRRAREGARRQAARGGGGPRRHLGRASRASSRPRAKSFDAAMPDAHQIARSREDVARRRATTCSRSRRARSPRRACGTTSTSASGTSRPGCAGSGCVPLDNLMEDAATAEISRAQVWQWIRHGARLEDGVPRDRRAVSRRPDATRLRSIEKRLGRAGLGSRAASQRAAALFDRLDRIARARGLPDPSRLRRALEDSNRPNS